MRQVHKAGEKCFVDYAGKKPTIVDPKTGERIEVEFFVAVMGASNYTYAEVTATQQSADWIASHNRLVEYLDGAPGAFVPDQLKSGVTTASRYEPAIQRTYEEWSQHYSTTILPARPASPRDKAKVEGGVLIVAASRRPMDGWWFLRLHDPPRGPCNARVLCERRLFIEGLALLALADGFGWPTETEYLFCPSIARVPRGAD